MTEGIVLVLIKENLMMMMFNYVALVCYVGLSNRQCSCRSFELFSDLSLFRYIRSFKQAIGLHALQTGTVVLLISVSADRNNLSLRKVVCVEESKIAEHVSYAREFLA